MVAVGENSRTPATAVAVGSVQDAFTTSSCWLSVSPVGGAA